MTEPDSGYQRLEDQIRWYDKKSGAAQFRYKATKIVVIVAAAAVTITALLGWNLVAAVLGAVAGVSEGLQQLCQWQHNWITYRATCEALRHEKYTYLEHSDVYDGMDNDTARKLLVGRIESLISTEHSKWIASQERSSANSSAKHTPPNSK